MTKFIGAVLLLILLSFQALATSAKIYVWRNEEGVLVFSDSPRPGAEEVKIEQKNDNIMSSIDTSVLDINPQQIEEKYEVDIIQPEKNATIRDNTGSVYLSARIKPIFKQGLKIQLYLDGKPHNEPQTHAMFILRDVDRGEHQVKMSLLDDKGKIIASSETITFYMHRATINKAK